VFAFCQSGGGRLLSSLSDAYPTLSCFEPKFFCFRRVHYPPPPPPPPDPHEWLEYFGIPQEPDDDPFPRYVLPPALPGWVEYMSQFSLHIPFGQRNSSRLTNETFAPTLHVDGFHHLVKRCPNQYYTQEFENTT